MVTPSRQRNLALVTRLYTGLQSGSTDTIVSALGPSIMIHVTGAGELDGVFRGRSQASAFYARVLNTLGPAFQVPPDDILVDDESLVVVPRGSTFGDADQGLDVYHFEEGLICEIWLTIWKVAEAESR